ncbi:concanavalin A-like lectin/glucanase domain-containing protein [Poronia punctata]|nr:concanavalin A-like lectin/glucanase domain-containing protein [Poronia punctata]
MVNRAAFLSAIAATASCVSAGPIELPWGQVEARQWGGGGGNGINSVQRWWNDFADVDFDIGDDGQFSVEWDDGFAGNFVVGRGYSPGRDMLVNYTAEFETDGAAYLALYGWTTNPLVEYYVIEAMGNHNPSDNRSSTQYGCLESDDGIYEVWQKERINAPSIGGEHTDFQQYWSIRTTMRHGGTINTGNHFRAWEAAGLELGSHVYMDIVVEGQRGSGSADVTVGARPKTKVSETPTPTHRSEHSQGTCPKTTATPTTTTKTTKTTDEPTTTKSSSTKKPTTTTKSTTKKPTSTKTTAKPTSHTITKTQDPPGPPGPTDTPTPPDNSGFQ